MRKTTFQNRVGGGGGVVTQLVRLGVAAVMKTPTFQHPCGWNPSALTKLPMFSGLRWKRIIHVEGERGLGQSHRRIQIPPEETHV